MLYNISLKDLKSEEDLYFCYQALQEVSRSFSVVIMRLNDRDLRNAVALFYVVLRALDTVEDDMKLDLEWKIKELEQFHTHLGHPTWSLENVGKGMEQEVLQQFPRVSREFNRLQPVYKAVIKDICSRMGAGMVEFLKRPVVTVADFDLYCHYVAGLVGHGLTCLFATCQFENPRLADDLTPGNEMGLFLQKTNIIRDYFEDIREEPPRMFWPKEIWGQYAGELREFADRRNEAKAVQCLNHMVANALAHIPSVLEYMLSLQDRSIICFCGIPQIMAIGTLCEVYNNPDTFHVKVKMSKVSACRVMVETQTLEEVFIQFRFFCVKLLSKLSPDDVHAPVIKDTLLQTIKKIDQYLECAPTKRERWSVSGVVMGAFKIFTSTATTILTAPFRLTVKGKKKGK